MILRLFYLQCCKRQLKVSVIGVPKTIDNDILLMDKTFGFDTAVEEAQRAINSAYIEVNYFNLTKSNIVFYLVNIIIFTSFDHLTRRIVHITESGL
jgi:6-phosphofructokinase